MKFITLPKVLEFFESGELFNLKFITCDYTVIMKLKTDKSKLALHAGEIIKIERCLLSLLKKNKTNKKLVNTNIFQGKKKKNPHHWEQSTRNIIITESRQIRKVEIHLITYFQRIGIDSNYLKVIY